MFKKLTNSLTSQHEIQRQAELYRRVLRHEAKIGGTLFGPVPPNRRREFFCLDEHTWVWHEQWTDQNNKVQYVTTRYDIRPGGIIKSQNGNYMDMTPEEKQNLLHAAKNYRQQVYGQIYEPVFKKANAH